MRTVMTDTGRQLAELRRSSAAGIHVSSGTRGSAKRNAIAEQMEDEMSDSDNVVEFPAPLEMEQGPSDSEILELDEEAQKVDKEFAAVMADYGLTADGEDYIPETDGASLLDDYRPVGIGDEDDYEWTANN